MIKKIRRNLMVKAALAAPAIVAIASAARADDFATKVAAVTLNMSPAESAAVVILGAVAAIWVMKTVIQFFRGR